MVSGVSLAARLLRLVPDATPWAGGVLSEQGARFGS